MQRLCLALAAVTFCAPAMADTPYPLKAHEAPDFALHAIAGGNVRLSEHRGDVVILSFWGSRCTPCREQLAALNRTNINVQLLTIEAALTGKRDTVYHAAMLDPHTSSELTLDQIRDLCDALIEAHGMEGMLT